MSTSTSSPGLPLRGDLLLAAGLVVALLAGDVVLRLADHRLSGNLAHVAQIPAIIETVATSADPRNLLLLGNSLTNNGVDAVSLAQAANLPSLAKVTPDGTSFWDWQCLLDHNLVDDPQRRVSTVVMGTAWHLLSNATKADASRLGALYCNLSDLRSPREIGLSGPGEIGEFIAARTLRLYALRDTLRNRALAEIVPHYKRFANEQNAEDAASASARSAGTPADVDYSGFTRLVSRLRARGTQVVIVMMPVKHAYPIDPALESLAGQGQIRLLDYRHLPGIDAGSFLDDIHLNPDGRRVLTSQLGRDLATDDASR